MTGNDIRRAYDRLRPDEDARERMLRAIREEAARSAETPHRRAPNARRAVKRRSTPLCTFSGGWRAASTSA